MCNNKRYVLVGFKIFCDIFRTILNLVFLSYEYSIRCVLSSFSLHNMPSRSLFPSVYLWLYSRSSNPGRDKTIFFTPQRSTGSQLISLSIEFCVLISGVGA